MKNSDATISQPQTDKLKSGDSINIKAVFFEALKNYVEKNNSPRTQRRGFFFTHANRARV